MDVPERDKVFSKLLARSLRQSLQLGGADCPGSDILAAFSEHSLSNSETSHWERHFSNCSRCQQVLAALALSGGEPAVAEGTEVAADEVMDRRVAVAPVGMVVAKAAAPSVPPHHDKAAAVEGPAPEVDQPRKIVMPPRRYLNWRWLVPSVAAAAALALWIAVRPARHSSIEIARQIEPSPIVSQPPAQAQKQATLEAQRLAGGQPKTPIKTPSPSEAATRPAKARPAPGDEANQGALKENAGATAGKFYRDRQTVAAGAAGGRESAKATDAQAEAPAIAAALEPSATRAERSRAIADRKDKADQEPAARPPHSDEIVTPRLAAPPPQTVVVTQEAVKTEQDKSSKEQSGRTVFDATSSVSSESKAKESSEIASDSQTRRMTEVLRKPSVAVKGVNAPAFREREVLIASPSLSTLWRVGPGGMIERSRDAGRTWQAQVSNVAANLVAGEAPSDTLCWVVGQAGTIMRTTDGEHWEKISSPVPADWTAVKARDAMNATVMAANGQRFVTADGGRTWRALPVK